MLLYCLVAVSAITPARASVVEIPATTTGFVENFNNTSYGKRDGPLEYGRSSYHGVPYFWRAYLKFNLDSLPDTCAIISAELDYYQYRHGGDLPPVNVRLIPDPVPLGAAELYWLMDCARSLTQYCAYSDGWVEWQFDTAGMPALDSCRRTGSVSLGVHFPSVAGPDAWALAYGDSDPNPPHLHVEYTASVVHEPQGILARRPELAFTPNPASGRFVNIRYSLTAATRGKLILRDVLGRTVRSFSLGPSARTRLDLRGLAPGVYMATLEASGQSVSRKLIMTAH